MIDALSGLGLDACGPVEALRSRRTSSDATVQSMQRATNQTAPACQRACRSVMVLHGMFYRLIDRRFPSSSTPPRESKLPCCVLCCAAGPASHPFPSRVFPGLPCPGLACKIGPSPVSSTPTPSKGSAPLAFAQFLRIWNARSGTTLLRRYSSGE